MSDNQDVIAYLHWSVDIECPYCGTEFNLLDNHNEDNGITVAIFHNRWDELKGITVRCPKCQEKFKLKKAVYFR